MTIFYDQSKPIEKIGVLTLRGRKYTIFCTESSNQQDEKKIFLFDLVTEKIFYLCRINEYEKIQNFYLKDDILNICLQTKVIVARFTFYSNKIRLRKIKSYNNSNSCTIAPSSKLVSFAKEERYNLSDKVLYEFYDKVSNNFVFRTKHGIVFQKNGNPNGGIFFIDGIVTSACADSEYFYITCFYEKIKLSKLYVYEREIVCFGQKGLQFFSDANFY